MLDPQGVHAEDIGSTLIVEGVQHEAHVVVGAAELVPLRQRGADGPGPVVEGPDTEVDGIVVHQYQDFRLLRGGDALNRVELGEGVEEGGAGPGRVVQPAVDADVRLGNRRCLHREFSGSPVVGLLGRTRPGEEGCGRRDLEEESLHVVLMGPMPPGHAERCGRQVLQPTSIEPNAGLV